MNKTVFTLAILLSGILLFACKKEKAKPTGLSDEALYALARDTAGAVWYQNGVILSGLGPHGNYKLRFNAKAATVLDGLLELPVGGTFPDSSLLVKEAHTSGVISQYIIMFKHEGNWLWAEYGPTGNIVYSFTQGSGSCTGCHTSNRDNTLTFDLH